MPEVVYFDTRTAAEIAQDALREAAREALVASDITVLRCFERTIPLPETWVNYRDALRQVVRTGLGPFPERPINP